MKTHFRSISSAILLSTFVIPLAFGADCFERGGAPLEESFTEVSRHLEPELPLKKLFDQHCVVTEELRTTLASGSGGRQITLLELEMDRSMANGSTDDGNGHKMSINYDNLDLLTGRCLDRINELPTAQRRYEEGLIYMVSGKQSDDFVEYLVIRPRVGLDEISYVRETGREYGLRQDRYLFKQDPSFFVEGSY